MEKAALVARISAAAVSLLYMLVLLPHFRGITAEHFSSGWFLGGIIIAFAWVPLLFLHHPLARKSGSLHIIFSFAPAVVMTAYFSALLTVASTVY